MTFSCADALTEVTSEYVSLPIETRAGKTVQLRNLLLLSDEGLRTASVLLKAFGDTKDAGSDVGDVLPKMRELILLVADDPKAMTAEVKDWPLGMYMRVIAAWQDVTSLGEAQDSDN